MPNMQSKKPHATKPHATKRYRVKPSSGEVTMLRVTGNPTAILKKLAGSKVQIVTHDDAAGALRDEQGEKVKTVGYYLTKIAALRANAINQKAFEPDARAQALLEGVR